jgi:aminoglycoside/choline kinase family phosphotransferase
MASLDALRAAGRFVASAAAVAGDAWRARWSGLPTTAREVTASWLEGVLAARYPGARIARCELLDDHSGTTSRARVAVHYADPGAGAPPATVFLKITPTARMQRVFLAAVGIGRNEVRFYRDVRPTLPVRAPGVHAVASGASDRQFVLVLEDLAASGARLATIGDRMDADDAARILDAMATLHAHYWESPRFRGDLAWLPSYERRRGDMPWERFVTGQMIGLARRRYAASLGPGLERAADTVIHRRDRLEALWSEGPRTFVHGDAHLGNLFFAGDEVGFLDWQVCGRAPGMRDVAYLLCNSLSAELREAHERALIRGYLDGLRARGVDAPDFDAAWRQYRLFALYTFIAAAFTAAAGEGLQAREIAEAGLRRATRAVESLESVACAQGGAD